MDTRNILFRLDRGLPGGELSPVGLAYSLATAEPWQYFRVARYRWASSGGHFFFSACSPRLSFGLLTTMGYRALARGGH